MNKDFYENLETIFTSARLSVYRQDGTDESTALARYLYNIELCRSLYVTLNIFEVSLRNAFDKALSSFAGENWYETLPLDDHSRKKVSEAKGKLEKKKKNPTHDRVIPELSLGFWTSLITAKYSEQAFQSYLIKTCLKKCPVQLRSVKNLQKIFERIRVLRNRVSHYERILHWKDLESQHAQLSECIKWLDESAFQLLTEIDFFDYIFSAGVNPFLVLVSKKWNW